MKKKNLYIIIVCVLLVSLGGCNFQLEKETNLSEESFVDETKEPSEKEIQENVADGNSFAQESDTNVIDEDKAEQEDESIKTEEAVSGKIELPYDLIEGKLELRAIFQSDILNPDQEFLQGVNLASVEVLNKSEEYLKTAEIAITLEDEMVLKFHLEDLPAGKTLWAFEVSGTSIEELVKCVDVQCEADYQNEDSDWKEQFSTNVEGATVEITNLTAQEQTNLKVIVHCTIDEVCFGGTSYVYDIEKISPSEKITFEVIESYFGECEVVRIIN